jgi:hypothetical protein
MTLPTRPTLFLAHCKAHKTQTQNQPGKELKTPTHSPTTPADGILITLILNINKTITPSLNSIRKKQKGLLDGVMLCYF